MFFMSKIKYRILSFLLWVSLLMTGLYAYIRILTIFSSPITLGDEGGFLKVFNIFITSGFSEANIYGNSTFFNCIS